MKLPETARRAWVASAPPEASHNTGQQKLAKTLGDACFEYFLELRAPAPSSAHTALHLYSTNSLCLNNGPILLMGKLRLARAV